MLLLHLIIILIGDSYPSEPMNNRKEELPGHEPAEIYVVIGTSPFIPAASRKSIRQRQRKPRGKREISLCVTNCECCPVVVRFQGNSFKGSTKFQRREMDRGTRFPSQRRGLLRWRLTRRRSPKNSNCRREFANCFLLFQVWNSDLY